MAAPFTKRQARYGALSRRQRGGRARRCCSASTTWPRSHNKRWDLTSASEFTLSDQTRSILQSLKEPLHIRVFGVPRTCSRSAIGWASTRYLSKQVKVDYLDLDKDAGAGQPVRDPAPTAPSSSSTRSASSGSDRHRRAGHHQRHHQGGAGPAAEGLLRHRPRRARPGQQRRAPATAAPTTRCSATTTRSRSWRWRSSPRCRRTPPSWSSPARRATTCRPRSKRCAAT